MRPVSAPDSRTNGKARVIACDLGVTGKRLRRALPPVAPAAGFRMDLRQQLGLPPSPQPSPWQGEGATPDLCCSPPLPAGERVGVRGDRQPSTDTE